MCLRNLLHPDRRHKARQVLSLLALGGLLAITCTVTAAGPVAAASTPAPASAHTAAPAAGHADKPRPARPDATTGDTFVPKPTTRAHGALTVRPNVPFTLTLSGPQFLWSSQSATITATANMDVGPTPYWIRIFDFDSNRYVATCGSGTTCSVTVAFTTVSDLVHTYQAYVGDTSANLPPGNLQATSNQIEVQWRELAVLSFAADAATLPVGASTTLTATTLRDVGPTPFFIELFDATTATLLTACGSGTSCSVTVSQGAATTHSYSAYVSPFSSSLPPAEIVSPSPFTVYITWSGSGFQITMTGPEFTASPDRTYTAVANSDVGPTPYFIDVYSETDGTLMAHCASGTTCSFVATGGTYVAFVDAAHVKSFPPQSIQASSNVLVSVFGPE